MAKDAGYSNYTCDRDATHTTYAKDGSAAANSWHTIKRYTQDGVEQSWLLDADCYAKYKALAARHDAEFNAFMAGSEAE